jgi:hypothetical protein
MRKNRPEYEELHDLGSEAAALLEVNETKR